MESVDFELFVHGVTNGEDFWGIDEDRAYFGNFYNSCTDEVKFFIQVRTSNGKPCCYYHYLVYKNIISSREGSYFGMTIRLAGCYCKEFANMYRLLDVIYNCDVKGKLLQKTGINLKYAVSRFSDADNNIKDIENFIQNNIIEKFCSNDSFISLNDFDFPMDGSNVVKVNLYDCTEENVMDIVKQNGCIAISPYYLNKRESKMENAHNEQMQARQKQYEEQKQKYDEQKRRDLQEYQTLSGQKKELETSLYSAQDEISQLKKKIKDKDSEIQNLRKNYDLNKDEISKKVSTIEKPLSDLVRLLKPNMPDAKDSEFTKESSKKPSNTPKRKEFSIIKTLRALLPFLNTLILFIILGLCFNPSLRETVNNTDVYDLMRQIESLEDEKVSLQKQLEEARATKSDVLQNSTVTPSSFDISNVKIDIKNYNGSGNLKIGQSYDVEAKNGSSDGVWDIDGCEIVYYNADPNKIQITPRNQTVKIMYCVGKQNKSRQLTAQ